MRERTRPAVWIFLLGLLGTWVVAGQPEGLGGPARLLTRPLPEPRYLGADNTVAALVSRSAEPRALAAADFDEDGVPDLVCSYEGPRGGIVTLHRGNVDAIYPNTPEASKRRSDGSFVAAPFLPDVLAVEMPEAPDFLGVGDFDADGHWDIVTAAAGGRALHLRSGDGQGGFRAPETIVLSGAVREMVVGEINRRDGLADVVVAIDGPEGARALVFEGPRGALRSSPEVLEFPAPIRSLALGRLDDDGFIDLAVEVEGVLSIVHGRDRRTFADETDRARVGPAAIETVTLPLDSQPVAIGQPSVPGRPGEDHWQEFDIHGAVAVLPMRLTPDPLADLVLLGPSGITILETVALATFVVRNTNDSGVDSLRQAIDDANATPGMDAIHFDIPGGGPHVIQIPSTELPLLSEAVTIDGSTQPGFAGTPLIELDGQYDDDVINGLVCTAACTIRSLAIDGMGASPGGKGITLSAAGSFVEGNFIGLDATGAAGPQQLRGVTVDGSLNTIGGTVPAARNVISDNETGIQVDCCNDVTIQGNYIGPDPTGNAAIGSSRIGVFASTSGTGLTIGGTVAGAGNVISANAFGGSGWGVAMDESSVMVQQNLVGIAADGITPLPNSDTGLRLSFGGHTIGGPAPTARNILSGNGRTGIVITQGPGSFASVVQNNFIGTNMSGTVAVPNGTEGIRTLSSENEILDNLISGNNGAGIRTTFTGRNVMRGNFIGTDHTGTATIPNLGAGVHVDGSEGDIIGGPIDTDRNLISGNDGDGILIEGNSFITSATVVQNNFIGTDVSGLLALGNQGSGVHVVDADKTLIGGLSGEGNVIAASAKVGVFVEGALSVDTRLEGNFIGVNAFGVAAQNGSGNGDDGVTLIDAKNTIVGAPQAGNIISGNAGNGVRIEGVAATGNSLVDNIIGLDITDAVLANGGHGVVVIGAQSNTIGTGNVISGNSGDGVRIEGASAIANVVRGSLIGTDSAGVMFLGNGQHGVEIVDAVQNSIGGPNPTDGNFIVASDSWGVDISGTAQVNIIQGNFIASNTLGGIRLGEFTGSTQIGGENAGEENTIAANTGEGVLVLGGLNQTIRLNEIWNNSSLGIDLAPLGVTPNDPGDPDNGANELQNFPEWNAAAYCVDVLGLRGELNSNPNEAFAVDLFLSASCDPSGHGQATVPIGSVMVITGGTGNAILNVGMTVPGVLVGDVITATATDAVGNTSEFSACVAVTASAGPVVEVTDLQWSPGSTTSLEWSAIAGATSYTLYLGDAADLPDLLTPATDSCTRLVTAGTTAPGLTETPALGELLRYLLVPEDSCGVGGAGEATAGPRVLDTTGACVLP